MLKIEEKFPKKRKKCEKKLQISRNIYCFVCRR